MSGERGQASVEWVGLVLLLALGLAALVRFAPREDAGGLGPVLVRAIGCAARGGCEARPVGGARGGPGLPRGMVSAPPLVPVAPGGRAGRLPRTRGLPRPSTLPAPLARGRALVGRAGRGAGVLWRRGWIACLGYERVRYAVLNPEIRFPRQTIPLSEDLRIANDCLSPVDLARDWDLIRGPR
jgi:hypothetical protein